MFRLFPWPAFRQVGSSVCGATIIGLGAEALNRFVHFVFDSALACLFTLFAVFGFAVLGTAAVGWAGETKAIGELPSGVENSQPPGESPPSAEAIVQSMRLPTGFSATVFAAEPDVQQPIGFDIDDRGRLWVAECYSYPDWKQEGEAGVDRVVILSDENGDGVHDHRTVFADGLKNLTSVACAGGGVWAICAPDLLFFADADSDDKPDGPPERRLTGFEHDKIKTNIASNLTWGPDGWLYGLHGIQARSMMQSLTESSVGIYKQPIPLECGLWRYHPRMRLFEPVCYGSTNPFGVDFNEEGEFFFTNCVIGHLWHAFPGGHFKRMYGPDIDGHDTLLESCSDHIHWEGGAWQSSRLGTKGTDAAGGGHAHSGCMIYLGDNWPDEYRGKLFTSNLHGRRLNCDILTPKGSGYVATHGPDQFFFDSPWFRGITLKYGPDGGVYLTDWTDAGECHDDDGVHRSSGRIYKIAYGQLSAKPIDLRKAELPELVNYLGHKNAWIARHAQRLLFERLDREMVSQKVDEQTWKPLDNFLATTNSYSAWNLALALYCKRVDAKSLEKFGSAQMTTAMQNAVKRFGGVPVAQALLRLAPLNWLSVDLISDAPTVFAPDVHTNPRVRLSLLSALSRTEFKEILISSVDRYLEERYVRYPGDKVNRSPGDNRVAKPSEVERDKAFCHFLLNLPPCLEEDSDPTLPLMYGYTAHELTKSTTNEGTTGLLAFLFRAQVESFAKSSKHWRRAIAYEIASTEMGDDSSYSWVFDFAANNIEPSELPEFLDAMRAGFRRRLGMQEHSEFYSGALRSLFYHPNPLVGRSARMLSVVLGDQQASKLAMNHLRAAAGTPADVEEYELLLASPLADKSLLLKIGLVNVNMRPAAFAHLAEGPIELATSEIDKFPQLSQAEQSLLVTALASKPEFINLLVQSIEKKQIPASAVSVFTARQILSRDDESLTKRFRAVWGEIRDTKAEAHALLAKYREQLAQLPKEDGSAARGLVLFNKNCRNCHKLFGDGGEMGPELTGADRRNADYVLLNVLDPSASVSTRYLLTHLIMNDGRMLSGVLQQQTGGSTTLKTVEGPVTVSTEEIEETVSTGLSPMPEGLLERFSIEELRDLLSYLELDIAPAPMHAGE